MLDNLKIELARVLRWEHEMALQKNESKVDSGGGSEYLFFSCLGQGAMEAEYD